MMTSRTIISSLRLLIKPTITITRSPSIIIIRTSNFSSSSTSSFNLQQQQQPFFPIQSSPNNSLTPIIKTNKPLSNLWFTAKPSLNETLFSLNSSINLIRLHLFNSGLLSSISSSINPNNLKDFNNILIHPRLKKWLGIKEMSTYLKTGKELKSSQYKKLTSLLSNLESLLPFIEISDSLLNNSTPPSLTLDPVGKALGKSDGQTSLAQGMNLTNQLETLLNQFLPPPTVSSSTGIKIERINGKDRKLGKLDEQGRIMAVGRRKESGARVWIVPVSTSSSSPSPSPSTTTDSSFPSSPVSTSIPSPIIPGQILINSLPLPQYFTSPSHRSSLISPLSLTSSLGSFNVFAIVRGGGLAAQAEAVRMGLARCLVEWERGMIEGGRVEEGGWGWRGGLKKAKVLDRDPRMVERKKTGQLKARKKMAWVKR